MSILIKGMDMPREDGTYVFAINISNGCAECVYWLKEDGGVSYRVVEVPTTNNDTKADMVEVKHGEWISLHNGRYKCSCCGMDWKLIGSPEANGMYYCLNCGAKMEMEDEQIY